MSLKRNSPLKRGTKQLKKSPLKKVSSFGKAKLIHKKVILEEDIAFYLKIWSKREHVCYETGEYLGEIPNTCFFHHVLAKELYPEYRHCEWNIVLLKQSIHNQVETNIKFCPKVLTLTEDLLNNHIKNNAPCD